jgi:hypothetical protein
LFLRKSRPSKCIPFARRDEKPSKGFLMVYERDSYIG